MDKTPCCGHAPITLVTAGDRRTVGYRCSACGEEYELCDAELSDGGRCERLVSECPYDSHRESSTTA